MHRKLHTSIRKKACVSYLLRKFCESTLSFAFFRHWRGGGAKEIKKKRKLYRLWSPDGGVNERENKKKRFFSPPPPSPPTSRKAGKVQK